MKKCKFLVLLAIPMLFCMIAVSDVAARGMPPGSFITSPVNSVDDLANSVKNDPVAKARYTRHFGMSAEKLADYFRANLKISAIKETAVYNVYYITKSGRLMIHKKWLKAGTKVFVDKKDKPVLMVLCGNPLAKELAVETPVSKILPVKPVEQAVLPVQEQILPPAPDVVVQTPIEPVQTQVLAEPIVEIKPIIPQATSVGGAAWLIPLLGIGTVLGGGGDVVPEPGSIILLATGTTCLAFIFRKRK